MKHLKWRLENPLPKTSDMLVGSAVHCMLLEGDEIFREKYTVYEGHRRGTEYETFMLENEGKAILSPKEWGRTFEIANSVPSRMMNYFGGDKEVSIFTKLGDVACKGRMDDYDGKVLTDLKLTKSIGGFSNVFGRLKYAFKLEMYRQMLISDGHNIDWVRLVVVENIGPYDCTMFDVPIILLENETDKVYETLEAYNTARENNIWPGIGPVQQLNVPLWSMEEDA